MNLIESVESEYAKKLIFLILDPVILLRGQHPYPRGFKGTYPSL